MSCVLGAIVAVTDEWAIGLAGDMVVANKADMRHFVKVTTGYPVIMGRKTLESFPGGRPLKNRRNVVITSDPGFEREDAEIVHSLEDALAVISPDEEAWVIGGGQVYAALLPHCERAVVTKNHCVRPADTYFPDLDADDAWQVESSVTANEAGNPLVTPEGIPFEFVTYVRR